MRSFLRRRAVYIGAFTACAVAVGARPALADAPNSLCSHPSLFSVIDDAAMLPALCPIARGNVALDATYFQNASAVGGTALAAFPLVRVRAGIADRVEAFVDTPSSVAESLLGGAELNPTTHIGYGLTYLVRDDGRSTLATTLATVPPTSPYATSGGQQKYRFDIDSGYVAAPGITLEAVVGALTMHDAGFGTVVSRSLLGTQLATTRSTRIAFDVGTQTGSRAGVGQSFGDASFVWRLQRSVAFDVGIGTAFNASGGTKPHYLSTGLTLRP